MDRAQEAARLSAIRRRVEAFAGQEWLLSAGADGTLVDARDRDGSLVTIFTFTGHASADEVAMAAGALDDARFLIGLVDRAIVSLRAHGERACGPASAGAADDGRAPLGASPASGSGLRLSAGDGRDAARKNHAAEAGMLCQSPAFKRFLIERHGLESPASDERAAQKLRGILGVTSRREIDGDEAVRARWIALRGDFQMWKGRAAA